MRLLAALLLVPLGLACSSGSSGPSMRLDFLRPTSIFDAPFPSADRQREDGSVDLSRFPNPDRVALVDRGLELLSRDARGFATTAGVFFSAEQALDPSSLGEVKLVAVEGPHALEPHPVEVAFFADSGPFGAPNTLVLLPIQGRPLEAATTYAALIPRSVRFATGEALARAGALAEILDGRAPAGMSEAARAAYARALDALPERGADLAALTVFRTDDPVAGYRSVRDQLAAAPLPVPAAFVPRESFPGYCVYSSEVELPSFQHGAPPFAMTGGGFSFDAAGMAIPAETVRSRMVVTLPRRPLPPQGFPAVLFIRTGGGGDRPLVDRGVHATAGGAAIEAGSGPAADYAAEGWAAISVDGPLGGLRNTTGADEQFLVYNFNNPEALRDNIRESALELGLIARALPTLSVPTATCAEIGAAVARFDPRHLVLAGHSMGASIAPLAFSMSEAFEGTILSGAGASNIMNLIYKEKPLAVRGFAELLLGYGERGIRLTEFDPVASLVQWATEASDAQVYAPRLSAERGRKPLHVLMFQGIVDHYIMPPMVHALVRSMKLDQVGPSVDAEVAELALFPPLGAVVGREGRQILSGKVQANLQDGASGGVIQHAADGIEDGHEVMYQTPEARAEARCFLRSLAQGAPAVAAGLCPSQ